MCVSLKKMPVDAVLGGGADTGRWGWDWERFESLTKAAVSAIWGLEGVRVRFENEIPTHKQSVVVGGGLPNFE